MRFLTKLVLAALLLIAGSHGVFCGEIETGSIIESEKTWAVDSVFLTPTDGVSDDQLTLTVRGGLQGIGGGIQTGGDFSVSHCFDDKPGTFVTVYTRGLEENPYSLINPYLFKARPYDHDLGLYDIRARWYSPHLGRWLSEDSQGYVDGENLYLAFAGDPVNLSDPTGEFAVSGALVASIVLNTALDVAIDYAIADITGGEFNVGESLLVNGVINSLTLGVGGKIKNLKHLDKLGPVGRTALRYGGHGVATGVAYDVTGRATGNGMTFGQGFVTGAAGEAASDVLRAGFRGLRGRKRGGVSAPSGKLKPQGNSAPKVDPVNPRLRERLEAMRAHGGVNRRLWVKQTKRQYG